MSNWEKTEGQTAIEAAAAAQETATAAQTFIGTCSTDPATAAKTVTGVTGFALAAGVCIAVTFSNANTAASPTLNIDSTGAKSIMLNGAGYAYWVAGATVQFIYDGTSWQVCNVPLYGATATIGNPASKNIYIDSDSIDFRQIANVIGSLGIEPYGTHNLLSLLCGANYDGVKVGGGQYAILDQRIADATYGRYGTYVIGSMHETGAPRLELHAYRGDGTVAHPIDKEAEIDVGVDAGGNSYIGVSADRVMGYPFARFSTAIQPVVLYNGGAALDYDTHYGNGTTGAVPLSELASHFTELIIYFDYGGTFGSVRVPAPSDGMNVGLYLMFIQPDKNLWVKTRTLGISGNSLINGTYCTNLAFSFASGQVIYSQLLTSPEISVRRVEGIK